MDRRKFVVRAVGMGAMLPLACDSQPVAPAHLGPSESQGDTGVRRDVRESGAMGDGVHDDTDAFARALDALPPEGGTLEVPPGVYLINPLRSVALRDGVTLALHPQAVLKAMPVAKREYYYAVVRAEGARNIRIGGGSIVGERTGHLGTGGEDGHGIAILGCTGVIIEDVYTGDCWGDGIFIASHTWGTGTESREVIIRRCRSVNNRRQGVSIVGCIGAVVEDCEFSDTNGTAPESGIDLEPAGMGQDRDIVRDVRIARCRAVRNAGAGMMLVDTVTDVILEQNVLSQNGYDGLFVRDSARFFVIDNTIELNGENGIRLEWARQAEIGSNVIVSNGCGPRYDNISNISVNYASSENLIAHNDFTTLSPRVTGVSRFDISVASPDCVGNRLLGNLLRGGQPGRGGILDNGSQTEITPPVNDTAERRNKRRRPPTPTRRSGRRFTPPVRGRR
jgi:parallel beta-helix repeat protein